MCTICVRIYKCSIYSHNATTMSKIFTCKAKSYNVYYLFQTIDSLV